MQFRNSLVLIAAAAGLVAAMPTAVNERSPAAAPGTNIWRYAFGNTAVDAATPKEDADAFEAITQDDGAKI
ncbi:hypothetical protein F5Y13DRAFT_192099 [Hypoxylon sp. FL1857]|nr:hypothetical protein F5Y13DRAFT_192099 [Hypoxylon sp. FL1857]